MTLQRGILTLTPTPTMTRCDRNVFVVAGAPEWIPARVGTRSGSHAGLTTGLATGLTAGLRHLAMDLRGEVAVINAGNALAGRVHELRSAIADPDHLLRLGSAVEGLVGFGPGLTPSGDDVLAACLIGLHRWSQDQTLFGVLAEAVGRRLGGGVTGTDNGFEVTSFVGRQLLQLALGGHTHEALDDVISCVGRGPQVVRSPLRRLLSIGATSGADSAVGLLCAIDILAAHGRLEGSADGPLAPRFLEFAG